MAVETYRQLVMQLLTERAQRLAATDEVEMQTIFDPVHDHGIADLKYEIFLRGTLRVPLKKISYPD